ncbi:MAG: NADH:ubiquinone reductase (Na(+)-transporting) subunit C [Flammeovirgaceae bacterium]|nr:NADH:ubiquinone reductase (Na(+)-transporting) subunit C [Flammeovirgaceae bacterium]
MQRSNIYILVFSAIMTVLIGGAMSLTSVLLKPAQDKQVELDTKKKILGAVMDISTISTPEEILNLYKARVKSVVVDIKGEIMTTDAKGNPLIAEKVNTQKNHKMAREERLYPIYMILDELDPNVVEAYVFPMFGLGLWDWISGYIALESDLNTVKGVAFDHKQETPGLGARITDENVTKRYKENKKIFNEAGDLESITMVKGEGKSGLSMHEVDGLSGATMTAKGVNKMLKEYLGCYQSFIKNKKGQNGIAIN